MNPRIRHILLSLIAALLSASPAMTQDLPDPEDLPSVRKRPLKGYSVVEEDGEQVAMIWLSEVTVYPELVFKNKKDEEFYWRTVRDVKKALPYAKLICETLIETYEYIETLPTQKEREEYLKRMERDVFKQYKPMLKKFTKSQAIMLVKLTRRETNQSAYGMLKAFLGSFRATFWQGFGKLVGVNLKKDYAPDKNHDDAIIERVATYVELGML